MAQLDSTHDATRKSWVVSANGHPEFPIQNLPFGVFSTPEGSARGGVAIGDSIVDLSAALDARVFAGDCQRAAEAAAGASLNEFLALGSGARRSLRMRLSELLTSGSFEQAKIQACLHRASDCKLHLPARIGNYTDFYVGIHHATHVGKLFRPDNPLLPNYKHVPIGYHGRASSVVASGMPVRRPLGQMKSPDMDEPAFGPSRRLDFELELGIWIGAGNELGSPIDICEASDHVAGFCLLNDWSARDIQAWEYQPLGPFLAKNFATSISPWIVTPEALAPFRVAQPARPPGDPEPLPYLFDETDQRDGAFDLELEVSLITPGMRAQGHPASRLSLSNSSHMYWTVAQMIAHHTSNGCNLQPADLLGTGTISGPGNAESGSMLELTDGGSVPITLPSREERRFLEDGDEVILRATARREGFARIGLGECRAIVLPPREASTARAERYS
jgi:fumarylacetoacetase